MEWSNGSFYITIRETEAGVGANRGVQYKHVYTSLFLILIFTFSITRLYHLSLTPYITHRSPALSTHLVLVCNTYIYNNSYLVFLSNILSIVTHGYQPN